MTVSRREFIRAGSVLVVAASISLGLADGALGQRRRGSPITEPGATIPIRAQQDPLFFMTRTTFAQYVNTTFVIDPGYTFPIQTTLVEVRDLRSAADKKRNLPGQECFALAFRAPDEDSLVRQNTYRVRHDALGTFELFVVPVHDKQGHLFYEAVINRLVP